MIWTISEFSDSQIAAGFETVPGPRYQAVEAFIYSGLPALLIGKRHIETAQWPPKITRYYNEHLAPYDSFIEEAKIWFNYPTVRDAFKACSTVSVRVMHAKQQYYSTKHVAVELHTIAIITRFCSRVLKCCLR